MFSLPGDVDQSLKIHHFKAEARTMHLPQFLICSRGQDISTCMSIEALRKNYY